MANGELVQLGDRGKDPVSGFAGIVTSITTWMNGCIRVGLSPEGLDKDGKPFSDHYFDHNQIELVDRGVHTPHVMVPSTPPIETRQSRGGPARESSNFRRS